MPWGGLALAVLVAYFVQATLAWMLGPNPFDPFLVLALLLGLLRPTYDARLSGWMVGLAQDLGSADPLGIHAFTLGLTALFATQLRRVLNANVWWSRGVILLGAAWLPQIILRIFLQVRLGTTESPFGLLGRASLVTLLAAAVVMAILALPWVAAWRRRIRRTEGAY